MGPEENLREPEVRDEIAKRNQSPRELVVSNESLVEYVIERSTSKVAQQVLEREERRHRNWTIVVAILGVVGVAGIAAAINGLINRALTSEATEQIIENISRTQLDKVIGELRHQIGLQDSYQQLTYLAFSLDFKDGFTRQERDTVLALLEEVSEEESVLQRPEFALILEKLVLSFASADQLHHANDILDLYRKYILDRRDIAIYLVDLFGRHLLHSRISNLDTSGHLNSVFLDLEVSSEANDFQEVLKPWRLALELVSNMSGEDEKESVRRHIQELQYLGVGSKAQALLLMFSYTRSDWYQESKDKTTDDVTQTFSRLFEDYDQDVRMLISGENGDQVVNLVGESMFTPSQLESFMDWASKENGVVSESPK